MEMVVLVIVIGIVSIVIAKCLDCMWGHTEAHNWQKLIVWGIGVIIPMIVDVCVVAIIGFTSDITDDSAGFAFIFSFCWSLVQLFLFLPVYHFKSIVEWMKERD